MAIRYPKNGKGTQWTIRELESIPAEWKGDRLADGGGLTGDIRVGANQRVSVRWRYAFKSNGKKCWYYCGIWPDQSLSTIRLNRDNAKLSLRQGINPNDKRDAERIEQQQKIDELLLKEQERKRLESIAQASTLRAYIENSYLEYQERKKSGAQTIAIIKNNFSNLLDKQMSLIDKNDILRWQREREKLGRAHSTIKRAYGALKTLLNRAVNDEVITHNPLERVKLEKRSSKETANLLESSFERRRPLSTSEISSLHKGLAAFSEQTKQQRRNSRAHGKPHLPCLDHLTHPHWFVPFTYIALYTGLRVGDIFSLRWNNELNIPFRRLVKIPNKTQHHDKPVTVHMTLPDQLITILKPWWAQQNKPQSGWVFPSPVNGEMMDRHAYQRHWKKIKQLAKLDEKLNFYAFRHNFISVLIGNGVPLFEVARLAGHKGTAMIEEHYGHLIPESAMAAMATLGEQFEALA